VLEHIHASAARSSAIDSAAATPPVPTAPAGDCPVRHLISHGADMGLEQQKALLGMQREKVTPGPPAFSLQSLIDVSGILVNGIHRAMLDFSIKYGPVSRWATAPPRTGSLVVCAPVGECAPELCSL
jgi:hypothetical protein